MPALSKSAFMTGCQCTKALYLRKYQPELATPVTEARQALFDRGGRVGEYAQHLFPGGSNAKAYGFRKAKAYTTQLLREQATVIYEATFAPPGRFVMVDILVKNNGCWDIYEVKSTTSVKEQHLTDTAMQYHTLQQVGLNPGEAYVVHLNNNYVRGEELDIHQLFSVQQVSNEVREQLPFVEQKLPALQEVLQQAKVPEVDIGMHCSQPYDCDFMVHCWQHVPTDGIFSLRRMSKKKLFDLYKRGIVQYDQLPEDEGLLNEQQEIQVQAHRQGKAHVDRPSIRRFLDALEYPLHYLDFETFQPAIPRYPKSRPYQQIPFQFSLHIVERPGAMPVHREFLAEPKADPRQSFIHALQECVGDQGSIVAYNQNFEKQILKALAEDFPEHGKAIVALLPRFRDLIIPFRNMDYYHPDMQGSSSLKAVVPVLVPHLKYEELEVQEGNMASITFEKMQEMTDQGKMDRLRKALLAYCKMDTLALVELQDKLEALAPEA